MNRGQNKKYIFITGGVTSSLGKGLAAASIGCLLERRGIKINMLKMDPYINVDPGTMSPIQHGEVFVTEDGAETDLDLGHYERFTGLELSRNNNFTTGKVYLQVIENEREGKYLGKTVQVVPHITDEIKRRIHKAAQSCDLLIGEIGGTVGDIESLPFMESIRQFALDVGKENVLFIHLVLVPHIQAAGELKSKPAQHSVKEMRSIGLFPDMIILRADRNIESSIVDKISLFCNVPRENVFKSIDLDLIYKVPKYFHDQGLDQRITRLLGMWTAGPQMGEIERIIYNAENPVKEVHIGIVGKYTELVESYKSLDEALNHASFSHQLKLRRVYIDAEELEKGKGLDLLEKVHGLLVPGGFGERGIEGKIKAIQFARENNKPFFGICLGMQLAVIEFARHVTGVKEATSMEFSEEGEFVIHYMNGQTRDGVKGASMRLGSYECELVFGSKAQKIYKVESIAERHRHRLEVNNTYLPFLEKEGLVVSGRHKSLDLVEVIELHDHPFFMACQFHPEFKSKPFKPHPLFAAFVDSCSKES